MIPWETSGIATVAERARRSHCFTRHTKSQWNRVQEETLQVDHRKVRTCFMSPLAGITTNTGGSLLGSNGKLQQQQLHGVVVLGFAPKHNRRALNQRRQPALSERRSGSSFQIGVPMCAIASPFCFGAGTYLRTNRWKLFSSSVLYSTAFVYNNRNKSSRIP